MKNENNPLFSLYKNRVNEYYEKIDLLNEWEIYEFFIMIHFILEFQINYFFRSWYFLNHISIWKKYIENYLDRVSFKDKIIMFINLKMFRDNFDEKIVERLLKNITLFCNFRNLIFHGSSFWFRFSEIVRMDWKLRDFKITSTREKLITLDNLKKQVSLYEKILEDFWYFYILSIPEYSLKSSDESEHKEVWAEILNSVIKK